MSLNMNEKKKWFLDEVDHNLLGHQRKNEKKIDLIKILILFMQQNTILHSQFSVH